VYLVPENPSGAPISSSCNLADLHASDDFSLVYVPQHWMAAGFKSPRRTIFPHPQSFDGGPACEEKLCSTLPAASQTNSRVLHGWAAVQCDTRHLLCNGGGVSAYVDGHCNLAGILGFVHLSTAALSLCVGSFRCSLAAAPFWLEGRSIGTPDIFMCTFSILGHLTTLILSNFRWQKPLLRSPYMSWLYCRCVAQSPF